MDVMDDRSSPDTDFVRLFTDGACSGNPGPGGWAFILEHPATGRRRSDAGAEADTTNNRMELQSVIEGMAALTRPCRVELVTDSTYVGKGLLEWMPKWKANGWRRKEGSQFKPVVNQDLWQRLDQLRQRHQVTVTIVKGHAGHDENEECDRMAVAAYRQLMAASRM
jgi:ribonuclease HI